MACFNSAEVELAMYMAWLGKQRFSQHYTVGLVLSVFSYPQRSLLRYILRSLLRHCISIKVYVKAHTRHINGGGGIGGGHFALCASERGEKLAVQQRWLFPPEPRGHVAGHPEVRVLSTRFA